MINYNIACVIVTYNRKTLLKRCLEAVSNQSYRPSTVYIIDNASTDGTREAVIQWGFFNSNVNGIEFCYHTCLTNTGGAGGFYTGLKLAFESRPYDGFWVMDDDGEPDKDCLKELVPHLKNRDYIAPIVLSDEDRTTCSFLQDKTYADFCKEADQFGVVEGWASPFNGILYSAKLIKTIGYPKKEMFIWGDEINYQLRAENAGFKRMTCVKAIHYHPIDRQIVVKNENTMNVYIVLVEANWKLYCAIRNRVYNLHLIYNPYVAYKKARELCKAYIKYYRSIGEISRDKLIREATRHGYLGYFGGLKKYFGK